MKIRKIIERIFFFLLVVWAASTITFFIPRISSRNPVRERFGQLARSGGFAPADLEIIIESFNQKFGLDLPLWEQYTNYVGSLARLDLGVSMFQFPKTVGELINESLPWTIGLLITTTILSFIIGNLMGAIAAWPKAPRWLRNLAMPFILFMGVPPVLLAIFLLFFIAFRFKFLPLGGAYSIGTVPNLSLEFALDVLKHQILPATAMIFGSVGGWVLSMRGMGITIQGEDYVLFAEHKGLSGFTIFKDYYLRNALLPQVTAFALALGNVVSSGIIIEQLFGLPGIGTLLHNAIKFNDFVVIYGVVLFITIAIAALMVFVELLYPLLDPRIQD